MNKQQQPASFNKLIERLTNEYAQLKERVDSLHSFLCDIDFEKRVPDPVEQRLMRDQLHMMLGYMENLRARISYQEQQQLRNMIETSIPHAPIDSIEKRGGDIIIKQANPSGQDAHDPCGELGTEGNPIPLPSPVDDGSAVVEKPVITGESIKKLMDYQVVGVCEPGFPCEGCVQDHYNTPCVKVELVGGYMLCLAPLPNSIMMDKPCS